MRNKLKVPWAQWQRARIAQLEAETKHLSMLLLRREAQLQEALTQRDGWKELAERLLKEKR